MGTESAFLCVADKLKTSELPVPDGNVNSYENKINIVFNMERVKNLQLLELGVYKCCFNCPHKVFGYYIKEHKQIYPKQLVIPYNF